MSIPSLSSPRNDSQALEIEKTKNKTPSDELTPKPIFFVHPITGEVATFYLSENPWKPTEKNFKHYRFCIACGTSKYSLEEWANGKIIKEENHPPSLCEQTTCSEKIPLINSIVAKQHLEICKGFDQRRAPHKPETGHYESFSKKTSIDLDIKELNLTDPCIPPEYKKKLSHSEPFERIHIFINIYFEYKEKNEIEVGKTIHDTKDPFLLWLASQYRQHITILQPLLRSRL